MTSAKTRARWAYPRPEHSQCELGGRRAEPRQCHDDWPHDRGCARRAPRRSESQLRKRRGSTSSARPSAANIDAAAFSAAEWVAPTIAQRKNLACPECSPSWRASPPPPVVYRRNRRLLSAGTAAEVAWDRRERRGRRNDGRDSSLLARSTKASRLRALRRGVRSAQQRDRLPVRATRD